ncbi:MAG: cytochrome c family protein [Alphaproteobacteria bacterium]|nr:cytochrome c family protein [Alphaproteobacteria bacterium]
MSVTARLFAIALSGACALVTVAPGRAAAQTPAPMPAGDAAAGEQVFRRLCTACHIPTAEGPRRLGPPLFGIVGRHSGTIRGFTYSQANRNADVTWTPEVLYEYLRNPRAFIVGTTMSFAGIRDDQERANVVAYLQTLR